MLAVKEQPTLDLRGWWITITFVHLPSTLSNLRKAAVPHFFGCLVNHLKLLQIQYHAYDRMKQVNCVLLEWLILPDVLSHLQLHLHTRHVTLTDVRGNDNPESLRKCCFMSAAVHLRSKDIQWRKTHHLLNACWGADTERGGVYAVSLKQQNPVRQGQFTLTLQATEQVQAG